MLGRRGADPQCVSLRLEQSQQAPEQLGGARRAAANVQIDRQHVVDPARHRVAAGKDPAVDRAIANAVYHATGKRVRDLPITLDKLQP